jgi:dolichol kinase
MAPLNFNYKNKKLEKIAMDIKREIFRKSIHFASLFFPITYYYTNKNIMIILLSIAIILMLLWELTRFFNIHLPLFTKILSPIIRQKESNNLTGASYLVFSYMYVTFFFSQKIAITAMLIAILADGFAALIGKAFNSKKLLFTDKTILGSLTFFIITLIILIVNFSQITIYIILTTTFIISMVELYTDKIKLDDNLSIIITTSLLLTYIK